MSASDASKSPRLVNGDPLYMQTTHLWTEDCESIVGEINFLQILTIYKSLLLKHYGRYYNCLPCVF